MCPYRAIPSQRAFAIRLFAIFTLCALTAPATAQIGTDLIGFAGGGAVYVTQAPGDPDPDRLFVVRQGGRIEVMDRATGQVNLDPFLDVATEIVHGGERGLLGLAFHPDYQQNGQFFVNMSMPPIPGAGGNHSTLIRRYQVSSNPEVADTNVAPVSVLHFRQDFSNHNGGWLDFGPDNLLYVATGDGGLGDDPNNRAQDLGSLLGKMLRIDVDLADQGNYGIPDGNPFGDEIWAYGLRNPWRNSFDRLHGDLYIGDVGQGAREEISYQRSDSVGGENYGWRLREGSIPTPGSVGGSRPLANVDPVFDYPRTPGQSESGFFGTTVTGGYVYRGPVHELRGKYFFADYGSDLIASIEVDRATRQMVPDSLMDWTSTFGVDSGNFISSVASFGEDNRGNLLIVSIGGGVYQVVPEPSITVMLGVGLAIALCRRRGV